MIEPFYFSPAGLFGIYHPARGVSKHHSVVIAGPLLNESMRAHHALRRVAITLAESGIDVLRFDYEGMGNSAGSLKTVMPDHWVNNIRSAVDELVEISGERKISIIAVRFAACLAGKVASDTEIEELILWDPIGSGDAWSELLQKSRCAFEGRARGTSSLGGSEYMGHIMGADFISNLSRIEEPATVPNTTLVVMTDGADISSSLQNESTKLKYFDITCGWEDPSSQVLFPHGIVSAICDHLR